jgi:nucleoid DNA-binding protein
MLNNNAVTARFIKEISEELNIDEAKVAEILNNFFDTIINFASQKKAIFFWLTGFGKIYYRKYKKPDVRRKSK